MPSPTRTPGPLDLGGVTRAPGPPDLSGLGGAPAAAGPRLVVVPSGWPPYDCDAHGAGCPAAEPAAGPAAEPAAEPAAGPAAGEPGVADPPTSPPAGAPPAAGPSSAPLSPVPAQESGPHQVPAALPVRFAQVIVEILAGARPARQIAPWATEGVRAQLDGLARLFAADRQLGAGQRPVPTAVDSRPAAERQPRIRRVVTSRPSPSVVEMTVVVNSGPRSRALAMRFEHVPERRAAPGLPARPARWLCTQMEAG